MRGSAIAIALATSACWGDIGRSSLDIDADPNRPDADPNAPDADPNAPDADPNAPDARIIPDAPGGVGEPPELMGITLAHNEVRAAHGVGPMTWQPALAATAGAWGDMCIDMQAPAGLIDHNPNRSQGHPYYVGENIYASSGNATAQGAVSAWAAEEQYYDYPTNSCDPGEVCGHYTQIVWANSVELGCAKRNCPNLAYSSTIICNYGPGGNISGQQPY
jgi:pathogenesis-related protein 1